MGNIWRRNAWGAALMVGLAAGALLAGPGASSEESARPVKLAIQAQETNLRAGTATDVLISLQDADNGAAPAPKNLSLELITYLPDGTMQRQPVTIPAGQSSARIQIPLNAAGIVELRAVQPQLLEGSTHLMVHPTQPPPREEPAAAPSEPPQPVRAAPLPAPVAAPEPARAPRPEALTRAPVGAAPTTALRLPADREVARLRDDQRLRLPSPLRPRPLPSGAARAPAAATPPATAAPTAPSQPAARPVVTLRYGPQGRALLADGKDEATISAFLVGGQPVAATDLRVRLFNSRGELRPGSPLVIARGTDSARVTLTSHETGMVQVEYLGSNPPVELDGERMLTIPFAPPITELSVTPSPPAISLLEQADLVVDLKDESGIPVVTDRDRVVSLSLESGHGILEVKDLTIPAGQSGGRVTFLPTGLGTVRLSASTPGLMKSSGELRVTMPLLLLSASALGALAGGGLAYLGDRKRRRNYWRILTGLITGFLLYLAAAFLDILPEFNLGAFHPFAVLLVSAVGGWLGTRIFDPIAKRFGLDTAA